jgi:hypothetical protein
MFLRMAEGADKAALRVPGAEAMKSSTVKPRFENFGMVMQVAVVGRYPPQPSGSGRT